VETNLFTYNVSAWQPQKLLHGATKTNTASFPSELKYPKMATRLSIRGQCHCLPRSLFCKQTAGKKAHPHHMRLTNFLTKKLAEINEKILEFEREKRIILTN
jgi:hypothetical protein